MHPEADAFLDAIFDNPDDDTPRLVYADWLQEHGQEDYAQFIRLSIQMSRSATPDEWKQHNSKRRPFWKRIRAVRYDASVGVPQHDYAHGILTGLTTSGDSLVRTITSWWPAMTPPALTVYGVRGFPPRSIETDVVAAVSEHMPYLRELTLLSGSVETILPTVGADTPLDGSVLAALSWPGILPRLRSLRITATHADVPTLRAFAESELVARLVRLHLDVRAGEAAGTEQILIYERLAPGAVQRALKEFLARQG